MANKNTKQARKQGLTNNPNIMIGTGTGKEPGTRRADPIFEGKVCDTTFAPDNKANKRNSPHFYPQPNKGRTK